MRSGQSTATHVTSEMGHITVNKSQRTASSSMGSSNMSGKKRKHVGRGGATYPNIGLETETETDGTYSISHTATTMSGPYVPPGIEVGPEDLFGEKAEGEFPETVTWFGDNALVREQVNEGDLELGQVGRREEDAP